MEDRIQINGIWYRRETDILTEEEPVDLDPCWSRTIAVENKNLCLEASVSCDDVDFTISERKYINIEVTDKRTRPWKTEHWDSEAWLLGVHKRLPESLDAFKERGDNPSIDPIDGEDRRFAIAFIDYLVEIGWVKE